MAMKYESYIWLSNIRKKKNLQRFMTIYLAICLLNKWINQKNESHII